MHVPPRLRGPALAATVLSLPLAALTMGCGHETVIVRVSEVPTSTPGVAYVVVRPGHRAGHYETVADRNGAPLDFDAEYLLLCDGRGAGALKCAIPPEVNDSRASFGPAAAMAPPADFGVGTLLTHAVPEPKDAGVATTAPAALMAPTAAVVPLPPVMAPIPDKTTTKEKKK